MSQAVAQFAGTSGARRFRYTEASAADTQLVMTVNPAFPFRLLHVELKYSGSVSKTATVVRDSGAGAAYDSLLNTITINAGTDGSYDPAGGKLFAEDESLVVTAAAGGGVVTSAISVYIEQLR